MSDKTNIRWNADSLEKRNAFDGYSRVVLVVSDEVEYTAGAEGGRTLSMECPWGTQAMADNLLKKINGFRYQPFEASGAMLDPSAELGDGINAGQIYSGIFQKNVSLGPMYTADVSAPGGEDINYKYEYKSSTERRVERQAKQTRATLKILAEKISLEVEERKAQGDVFAGQLEVQSSLISAKVSKTGGDYSSFGWELTDSMWRLIANNAEVLRATRDGLDITGIIRAKGGMIGGFDIRDNYLSYNGQTWGGTNSQGAYIGISGIQLGRNFKVDMYGNLWANSGEFAGSVRAGSIQYGGDNGYFNGSGLSDHSIGGGKVGYNTISTSNTSGGINASLGYADFANGVFNGWNKPAKIIAASITATSALYVPAFGSTRRVTAKQVTINGFVHNILTV